MSRGWAELIRGGNAARSAVVGGGMILHAINVFIVTTTLPTVVSEIGGLRYFAWTTTLYVVASLLGGATCARLLRRLGARVTYRLALGLFALGCLLCAVAPAMAVLLLGRFAQGLGSGTLSALSFTMVRLLFPRDLWARALAVISAMWGIATLLGPAVGGVFAQYGAWRAAFWSLLAVTPLLWLLVETHLPRDMARTVVPPGRMAFLNLAVLTGSVLAVSAASTASAPVWNALGLLAALAGLAVFVRLEASGTHLLPRGACDPATPLGATYAAMALLLIGVTTEIFVPYFLQTLHGLIPLHAGYMSALMSGGWTLGSMLSSGTTAARARAGLGFGPVMMVVGLAGLFLLMPQPMGWPALQVGAIGVCLAALGLGIGMCWPQLGTRVFAFAGEGERELAAASITTVIMVGNAFGSALGGMVTNLAGLSDPGGMTGAARASAWLFGLYGAAPGLAWVVIRGLLRRPVAVPAG